MRKERTSFCEQKEAKKLLFNGPWVAVPPTPVAQHKKSLFGSFSSEKELLILASLP
jgi:hypothetical protein